MGAIAFFTLIAVLSFLQCDARPDGAPASACYSLTPKHSEIPPQRSSAPYSITATKRGNKVEVKLLSSREEFQGFILQPRLARDRRRIVNGHFTTESGVTKTLVCNGTENTLTMVNPSPKREVRTEWIPDSSLDEEVVFRGTFAQTFAVFWVEVESNPVRIQSDGSHGNHGRESERNTNSNERDKTYVDCSISKGCFGIPGGCINNQDCQVLLTYTKLKTGVLFNMFGTLEDETYMAIGISNDMKMGDDSVTECMRRGSRVLGSRSWNNGKSNEFLNELEDGAYEAEFLNGMSTCSFTLNYVTETNGRTFNLANNTYYILLAKGPLRNGRLSYHSLRETTQQAVNFNDYEIIDGEGVSDSVKIHGAFMCTAWVGLVSIAILLARHFKTWEQDLCQVKIWFALHRCLMLLAVTLVVIAFIVIFIHKDGWNYETDNPHAILGVIATILGLLQPIMALFRPGPDHPKRPIFNWLHFICGNASQLFAVITIFYARKLEASGLDNRFYSVMAVFVVVYLLFHLFLQLHTYNSERKKNNEVKMLDLASRGGNTGQNGGIPEKKGLVNQALRQIFLAIYIIFVVAILIALYALIGAA